MKRVRNPKFDFIKGDLRKEYCLCSGNKIITHSKSLEEVNGRIGARYSHISTELYDPIKHNDN